jgi:hypothetical protein
MSDDRPGASRGAKPRTKKMRRMARKAAAEQGHDWASLSKEDRKTFKAAARETIKTRKSRGKAAES